MSCLSVRYTSGASFRPENAVTYSAGNEGQKICGVFSETASLQRSSTPSVVRPCVQSAIFPCVYAHAYFSCIYAHDTPPRVQHFSAFHFQHDLCCKIIKSEIDLKLKARSEFSNVWGEYKDHSNPFIQGTTVPCDIPPSCISLQYLHLPISNEDSWDLSALNSPLAHTCTHVHTHTSMYVHICTNINFNETVKHHFFVYISFPQTHHSKWLPSQSDLLSSVATTNRFQSSTCLESTQLIGCSCSN